MLPGNRVIHARNILKGLEGQELRELARHHEKTTIYGSPTYLTKITSRSAQNTYIVADELPLGVRQKSLPAKEADKILDAVHDYLKDKELVQVDRRMGEVSPATYHCRLYVTKEYARLAHMWHYMLFPHDGEGDPDFVSVYVPEWPELIILAYPEEGVTYILGTDYFGEAKKSFLRQAMYRFKVDEGGLGFHAGSKILRVKDDKGQLNELGFIMFGMSGTGKTTLTIHDHGLTGEEGIVIRQDDVLLMDEKGHCYGTEDGFFIKTEGLDESQRVLYDAATGPRASFENIMVHEDGTVDFDNVELTSNGRGVIPRRDVEGTDDTIDLPKAHRVIFITRRDDIIPPVVKLDPVQAAAFFMLGETIETSAGDPTKAGQSKREVGTNPFIIGPEAEEGNRFLAILRANPDMECFLLNTGSVGAKGDFAGEKITISVTTDIMKALAKGGITWAKDPDWGYQVALEVPGVDMKKYTPSRYYTPEEYRELVEKLRQERRQWLAQFPGLDPEIVNVV
ncbi:MAG: phosphoenolpyruvate carboxykinase (ATP) [Firmicutes bacterium]|nr:phosphoenolpyruvate carboxykinase (ATP) [Bacillota bacterium]